MLESKIVNLAITDRGFALILKPNDSEKVVPIFIATMEAQSIMIGFLGFEQQRPLSHDIFKDILVKCSIELKYVIITEIREDTFYSKIVIESRDGILEIDSRPSDAIALALRMKALIYLEEEVLDAAGIIIDESDSVDLGKSVPFNYQSFDFDQIKENISADTQLQERAKQKEKNDDENQNISEKEKLLKMLEDAVREERYEDAALYRDKLKNM